MNGWWIVAAEWALFVVAYAVAAVAQEIRDARDVRSIMAPMIANTRPPDTRELTVPGGRVTYPATTTVTYELRDEREDPA